MQSIDCEKLISEVEKRPALWDMRSDQYSDRLLRRQSWDEICKVFANKDITEAEMNELGVILHKKWKNIRDNFARDIQRRKRKSGSGGSMKTPYMYSQHLEFLRDTIEPKQTSNSLEGLLAQQPGLTEDAGSSLGSLRAETTPAVSASKKNKLNPVEERIILSLERIANNKTKSLDDDDNRHFLLSLLPNLSSLPKRLNSKCRIEIMQILDKFEGLASIETNEETPKNSAEIYQNSQPKTQSSIMQCTHQQPQTIRQQTVASQGLSHLLQANSSFNQYKLPTLTSLRGSYTSSSYFSDDYPDNS